MSKEIKANEVRIGNIVFSTITDEEVEIAAILQNEKDIFDFEVKDKEGMFSESQDEDVESILLTEDWLLKFGFEKKEDEVLNFRRYPVMVKKHLQNYWSVYIDNLQVLCSTPLELKHVHQLQNLYFDLTQKELTIK